MDMMLLFIAIITNAGGEGKTALSSALAAILQLLRYGSPTILDGDPGNWASSVLSDEAERLGWTLDPGKAPVIANKLDGNAVILDAGANAYVAAGTFLLLTQRLGEEFKKRDYRAISLHPVSTNKIGAMGSMIDLAEGFPGFEQVMVLVNRDGSDHYLGDQTGFGERPVVRIGYLQPGLIEVAQLYGSELALAVTKPKDGYVMAGRFIGQWLANVAGELERADVLPRGSQAAIAKLFDPPPRVAFALRNAVDCTDEAFHTTIAKTRVFDFLNAQNFSREALLAAADKFHPQTGPED
jgi:hypothetical protein